MYALSFLTIWENLSKMFGKPRIFERFWKSLDNVWIFLFLMIIILGRIWKYPSKLLELYKLSMYFPVGHSWPWWWTWSAPTTWFESTFIIHRQGNQWRNCYWLLLLYCNITAKGKKREGGERWVPHVGQLILFWSFFGTKFLSWRKQNYISLN